MRINGIGATYLGPASFESADVRCATYWFTVLFLPVIPLGRWRLRLHPLRGGGFAVTRLNRTPLIGREILGTLFWGWIAIPALVLTPLVLALLVSFQWHLVTSDNPRVALALGSVLWIAASGWKLLDWHEDRFQVGLIDRPRDLEATAPREQQPPLDQLAALEASGLLDSDPTRAFVAMEEILRSDCGNRGGISCESMSTRELIAHAADLVPASRRDAFAAWMMLAERVKFAGTKTTPDEASQALVSLRALITD